jgi:predicted amidohydrolase
MFLFTLFILAANQGIRLNMTRAEGVLDRENPKDLDLIVLPEMAFTGKFIHHQRHSLPPPFLVLEDCFSPKTGRCITRRDHS